MKYFIAILFALALTFTQAKAAINIDLRPSTSIAAVDTKVNIGIYLTSDSKTSQLAMAADVVFGWDKSKLQFLGIDNSGTPPVTSSSLPLVKLNESNPPQDGDGFYMLLGQLGSPLACPPEGVLVTTLQFRVTSVGPASVTVLTSANDGQVRYSRVLDGTVPNLNKTGTLGTAMVNPAEPLTEIPVTSAPVTPVSTTGPSTTASRQIVECPNGGIPITKPGQIFSGIEYRGYTGPGVDGRCVNVFVPKTIFFDDVFVPGNDDPLGFVGNTSGSLVVNCEFKQDWAKSQKALIGYTNPGASNIPGPIYGHDAGYAATMISNAFHGSAIRMRDGVFEFRSNIIVINALYGMDFMDVKANIIDNDFIAIEEKPAGAPYWMQRNADGTIHPCPIRICGTTTTGQQTASNLKSRLYCYNNRIRTFKTLADAEAWIADRMAIMNGSAIAPRNIPHTVVNADGPMIVRAFPTDASRKLGWTAYQPMGQGVPKEVFLKTSH